ncbi:ArsR/SmtB family transcription factor [Lentzea sp. NPDC059081]|uniref:ArsR/SmtB family transcription factor n=1 Tax=Lentzea sp. NPDC059081 TaxID=3346719 RepID=UPI0036CF1554
MTSRNAPELPMIADECVRVSLIAEPLGRPEAARLAKLLKAVADPARLQLLSLVHAAAEGEACVCDLTEPLGLSQPTVSHHLKILAEAGMLTRERRGTWVYYRLVPERWSELRDLFG